MKKNIKISSIPAFRRTLKSITNIPEMSLSSYVLRTDMNLSEMEFTQKYYFSSLITTNDFKALVDFLNKQKEENKEEIQDAQNYEQITTLINQLVALTDFEKINKTDNKKTKAKPVEANKQLNLIQVASTKENAPVKQKRGRNVRTDSIQYTKEMADSFNTIISLLQIPPFNPIYGKLPIATSYFYYLKSHKKNGKDFNVVSESISKMSDYFVPVIKNKYHNLSAQEQETLRDNFESFTGQSFPDIDSLPETEIKKEIPNKISKVAKPQKEEILPIEKDSDDTSSGSTTISIKASKAIKNICSILNLRSQYKQDGGVPLSEYSLHYWTKPVEKGVNTKKLLNLKNYFQNIISTSKKNLSNEDWNDVKQNWETFNSEIYGIQNVNIENAEAEMEVKQLEIIDLPVVAEEKNQVSHDNSDFVLSHLELIKKKKEADQKLEKIILQRIEESYKRDRLLKVQDAIKDMPVLSILALSREKQYSEKVYEIKDFTISNKKDKDSNLKGTKSLDFISENLQIDSSENKLSISEVDYEQYQILKDETQKAQGKVEVKLILDIDSKLSLYLNYDY